MNNIPPKQDMSLDKVLEEFEERKSLKHQESFLSYGDDDCPPEIEWEVIKAFIRQTYQLGKQEGLQEAVTCAEKMKKDFKSQIPDDSNEIKRALERKDIAYLIYAWQNQLTDVRNQTLSDLQTTLSEGLTKK